MGSNIICIPLHNEARKYIKELRPDEILPSEQPKNLTYEDLKVIFERLKRWGWILERDSPDARNFDVQVCREINGDEGSNLWITLWIKEQEGKPDLMFHKGRHSIGLFIAREIAKLCGPQCVVTDADGEKMYVVTGEIDLTLLMANWLNESLYGDYWQKEVKK